MAQVARATFQSPIGPDTIHSSGGRGLPVGVGRQNKTREDAAEAYGCRCGLPLSMFYIQPPWGKRQVRGRAGFYLLDAERMFCLACVSMCGRPKCYPHILDPRACNLASLKCRPLLRTPAQSIPEEGESHNFEVGTRCLVQRNCGF